MIIKAGSLAVSTYVVLRTAADGTATTGATITNIDLQYVRSGVAPSAMVNATALGATDSAHDGGNKAIEIDATDAPGLYRVDWPDAAFAAGVGEVILSVKLASSFTEHLRVELSPPVDAVAISGDTVSADNLELQYDTTGITGDTFPASQAQVDGIGTATGTSLAQDAGDDNYDGGISGVTVGTTKVGTQTGSYASTSVADGVAHVMTHAGQSVAIVYQFQAGGGTSPATIEWLGLVNPINDTATLQVWDHVGNAWETLGTREGQTSTTLFSPKTMILYARHMGTSVAELGNVYLQILSVESYNHIVRTDQVYLTYAVTSRTVGYAEGAIWVDSAGTAGSVNYVNGTADNPCPWANAQTINTSLGLNRFHIANGNTLTLGITVDNMTFYGDSWTLDLDGRQGANAHFSGADVTGILTGATAPEFHDCILGAVTLPPCKLDACGFGNNSGQFTAGSAGQYVIVQGFSVVPGAASPAFVFTGLGAPTGINNRGYFGGATWTLDSDCTLSHEVVGGGGTTITTGGGAAEIRGTCRELTVTASAAETVQFVGVTGPITLNGTTTATFNLYGVSATVTDNTSAGTVNDFTTNRTNYNGGNYALNTTAAGNIGIDWANVENPTTALALSQTDIQLCDTVTTNSDLVSAAAVVNEWETQSQADPTGFHVNVMEWLSTAPAPPVTAGVPRTDPGALGGSVQSLADLKDFADSGYDPVTNKVQGVVLVDSLAADQSGVTIGTVTLVTTTTTNTDMVAAAPTATAVADAVLIRAVSNIEDTADKHSLGALVMMISNGAVAAGTLTAKKPSDDTTFQTYTVTSDASADPITGLS